MKGGSKLMRLSGLLVFSIAVLFVEIEAYEATVFLKNSTTEHGILLSAKTQVICLDPDGPITFRSLPASEVDSIFINELEKTIYYPLDEDDLPPEFKNDDNAPTNETNWEITSFGEPAQNKIHLPKKGGWRIVELEFGILYGHRGNVGFGPQSEGFSLNCEVVKTAFGISALNGLGLGTTIWEFRIFENNAPDTADLGFFSDFIPTSFFPIYFYYPIKSRKCSPKGWSPDIRAPLYPFIYLFGGGSKWGAVHDYIHAGVSADLFTYYDPRYPGDSGGFSVLNYGLQCGIMYTYGYMAKNNAYVPANTSLYFSLLIGFGGAFE
jgi:hypothetical protein